MLCSHLEGDVADGKADPSACHQLGQVSVLQYFQGTACSMDHHHVFRQAGLFWKVLATVVALFWQTGQGGKWQVIWSLRRHKIIHDVLQLYELADMFAYIFWRQLALTTPHGVFQLSYNPLDLSKWWVPIGSNQGSAIFGCPGLLQSRPAHFIRFLDCTVRFLSIKGSPTLPSLVESSIQPSWVLLTDSERSSFLAWPFGAGLVSLALSLYLKKEENPYEFIFMLDHKDIHRLC